MQCLYHWWLGITDSAVLSAISAPMGAVDSENADSARLQPWYNAQDWDSLGTR